MSSRGKSVQKFWCGPDSAFTILELLVAATLTVVIAGVIVGLIASVLSSWNRTYGALSTGNQARAVLDQVEQDLQGAWCRDDGNAWLVATVQSGASASGVWVNGTKPVASSLNPAAPNLADARFGLAGVWLRFFTTATGVDLRGNELAAPIAVSYQIIRRGPTLSSAERHYLLYRAAVPSPATLGAGYDLDSELYNTGSDTDGAPGNVVRPGVRQVLADNVIDFGVRFYGYAPDAVTGELVFQIWFPRDDTDLAYRAQSPMSAADPGHRLPAVADVLLRLLTAEGARQIAALESGRISGDWWAIANANSQVFVRRIQLKGASP